MTSCQRSPRKGITTTATVAALGWDARVRLHTIAKRSMPLKRLIRSTTASRQFHLWSTVATLSQADSTTAARQWVTTSSRSSTIPNWRPVQSGGNPKPLLGCGDHRGRGIIQCRAINCASIFAASARPACAGFSLRPNPRYLTCTISSS